MLEQGAEPGVLLLRCVTRTEVYDIGGHPNH